MLSQTRLGRFRKSRWELRSMNFTTTSSKPLITARSYQPGESSTHRLAVAQLLIERLCSGLESFISSFTEELQLLTVRSNDTIERPRSSFTTSSLSVLSLPFFKSRMEASSGREDTNTLEKACNLFGKRVSLFCFSNLAIVLTCQIP